jgi:hypothetical protein
MEDLEDVTLISFDCNKDAIKLMASQKGIGPDQFTFEYFSKCALAVDQFVRSDSAHIMYSQVPFTFLFLGQSKPNVKTDYMRVLNWTNVCKGDLGMTLFQSWFKDGDKVDNAFPSMILSVESSTDQNTVTTLVNEVITSLGANLMGDVGVMTIDNKKITLSSYSPVDQSFGGWIVGDNSYCLDISRLQNEGSLIISALFQTDGSSKLEQAYKRVLKQAPANKDLKDVNTEDRMASKPDETGSSVQTEDWAEPPLKRSSDGGVGQKLGKWASKLFEISQKSKGPDSDSWADQGDTEEQVRRFKEENKDSVLRDAMVGSYFGRALRIFSENHMKSGQKIPSSLNFYLITVKDIPNIRLWIQSDADRAVVKKYLLEKLPVATVERLCTEVWGTDRTSNKAVNRADPASQVSPISDIERQLGCSKKIAQEIEIQLQKLGANGSMLADVKINSEFATCLQNLCFGDGNLSANEMSRRQNDCPAKGLAIDALGLGRTGKWIDSISGKSALHQNLLDPEYPGWSEDMVNRCFSEIWGK